MNRILGLAAVALAGCGGGGWEGDPEETHHVAPAVQELLNTVPRGPRWIVPYGGAGGLGPNTVVEIVFDSQNVYWLTSGRTGTPATPARIYRAPRAGGGSAQLVTEFPDPATGETERDLAIRGTTLYFATGQQIGAILALRCREGGPDDDARRPPDRMHLRRDGLHVARGDPAAGDLEGLHSRPGWPRRSGRRSTNGDRSFHVRALGSDASFRVA